MTARIIRLLAALVALTLPALLAAQQAPRESWQRVDDVLAALGAGPGAQIADVGAGDGFFTRHIARAVGESGGVHAVDVNEESLDRLRWRIDRDGLRNVTVIEGAYDDPRLPGGAIDGALIVNAYHEMTQHQAMLDGIAKALKPGGRLVIVEPISERYRDAARADQTRRHEIDARFVLEDLREAGFRIVRYEEEFARRPHGEWEWIIVATPRAVGTRPAADGRSDDRADDTAGEEDDDAREDWRSASLRIELAAARALHERGDALFVDVRNLQMFEDGHLPGARLLTLDELAEQADALAASGRRVIAYCS